VHATVFPAPRKSPSRRDLIGHRCKNKTLHAARDPRSCLAVVLACTEEKQTLHVARECSACLPFVPAFTFPTTLLVRVASDERYKNERARTRRVSAFRALWEECVVRFVRPLFLIFSSRVLTVSEKLRSELRLIIDTDKNKDPFDRFE